MMFSVAPTLGKGRMISVPRSFSARQQISPASSSISAPICRRAARCRSMGRFPSWHPPGRDSRASPQRASSAPMKMTEERISTIREWGMLLPERRVESMYTSPPRCSARQPRCRSMRRAASTSRSWGTFISSLFSGQIIEAAIMGSEAFFEPWTKQAPRSRFPPLICHISIKIPPVHSNHAILCRGALICSFFRRPLCGQGL